MSTANSTLRLSVEHNQYDQGLREAKKSFEDFTKSIGVNIKSMTAAGAAIGLAAAAVSGFSDVCREAFQRGSELAKQAEGVRLAYQRLGDSSLLDGLREATHNTVSDLELMKAAVKFQDFKLPIEELGTMLAFAQQKAKDTGQSVDYMVDSIVTGLGRKSLMILDNLGLSAAEVKEKMKETGDMTKAVGAIIREQMSKAGDYVETAADRATQANVELENAMLDLGNAMKETFGYTGWDDMAKGIKTELVGALTFTIETINEAKGAWNSFMQLIGAQDKPAKPKPSAPAPNGSYFETTDADGNLINAGRWLNGKQVVNTMGVTITGTNKSGDKKPRTKGGGSGSKKNVIDYAADSIKAQEVEVQRLTDLWKKSSGALRDGYLKQLEDAKFLLDSMTGKIKAYGPMAQANGAALSTGTPNALANPGLSITMPLNPLQEMEKELQNLIELQQQFGGVSSEVWQMFQHTIDETNDKIAKFKGEKVADKTGDSWEDAARAIQSVGGALQSIEDPGAKIAGLIGQAIANIALGFAQATAASSGAGIFGWIAAIAGGLATMVSTIEAIHSATGYAEGGVVKGNTYSGDKIPAMLNAGEVVLSKAAAGNLASQFSDVGLNNLSLQAVVTGTQLRFVLNNESQSRGRGQYVTTNFNR
jgi:hypothetical protein